MKSAYAEGTRAGGLWNVRRPWAAPTVKIVEIPCSGSFTRRIGSHVILVTAETRRDPEGYRAALRKFR